MMNIIQLISLITGTDQAETTILLHRYVTADMTKNR